MGDLWRKYRQDTLTGCDVQGLWTKCIYICKYILCVSAKSLMNENISHPDFVIATKICLSWLFFQENLRHCSLRLSLNYYFPSFFVKTNIKTIFTVARIVLKNIECSVWGHWLFFLFCLSFWQATNHGLFPSTPRRQLAQAKRCSLWLVDSPFVGGSNVL